MLIIVSINKYGIIPIIGNTVKYIFYINNGNSF